MGIIKRKGSRSRYRRFKVVLALGTALVASTALVAGAVAYANSVTYSGQGLIADGFGGYDLVTEKCGVANGADVDGPYTLWVLTANGATNADITGPWGTATMKKSGNGTFKYVSAWYDPDTLPGNVTATYDGKAKNAQLTISHGCRPFTTQGAWCSPGFWGQAQAGAWSLIGVDKSTATFGGTVASDPQFAATDPTRVAAIQNDLLQTVMTATGPGTAAKYKNDPVGTFKGWAANPFNLSGAWLTNQIPGYTFDPDVVSDNDSVTCPIDHFGDFKNPQ